MADLPISGLTETGTAISTDLFAIVTDNATIPVSKKITFANLLSILPTGIISPYAGATAPTGWLLCNGATVSQTTYAALFAITGHTYGTDPGGGNFILPNLKGRVPVGKSTDIEFDTLGKTGGEKAHVLTVAEMPAHTHTIDFSGGGGGVNSLAITGNLLQNYKASGSAGGGTAHTNLQPYLTINYIIKY